MMFLLLPTVLVAQTARSGLSGTIKDSSGVVVPAASVYLENTLYGATSDAAGRFDIKEIPPGKYILVVAIVGYETRKKEIILAAGRAYTLEILLKESVEEMEEIEIIIKSEAEKIMETGYSVYVIEAAPLQNRNLDVNKALTQASGVRLRQDAGLGSSFSLTMNGLRAAQFINGIPVDVFGTAYRLNNIPINQAQRIEVYKGVVPAYLGGDALGGAVNLVTKTRLTNSLNASYSYGSFNTHRGSLYGVYRDSSTGLTAIASGFINYSDNDYVMKNMEINRNSYYEKQDVRRFNDRYFSYSGRIETGVTGKKYADALLFSIAKASVNRGIQTGPLQYPAAGEVTGNEDNTQLYLNYRKEQLFHKKIDVNLFVLYSTTHTLYTDTSSNTYQWDGSILYTRPPGSQQGELDEKQLFRNSQTDFVQRYNLIYHIHARHDLTLNYISAYAHRKSRNDWTSAQSSGVTQPSDYTKSILGVGYDSRLLSDRLKNSLFVKMYQFNAKIENALSWENGYFRSHGLETKKTFWGAGGGSSFALFPGILIKGSIEYAYRIPYVYELLGDGLTTIANTNLLPESSMNYNTGYSIRIFGNPGFTMTWSSSGFLRHADNFIRVVPANRRITHANFNKVLVRGIESDLKATIAKKIQLNLNLSYQQVLDDNRFVGRTRIENYTYRQQLPNTPFLFGNADISYAKMRLLGDRLFVSPYYALLYVHKFYLGYANVAKGGIKNMIPTQFLHDLGVTFSRPGYPLALSFECTNLTNSLAYDNFRLQKPGRAYAVKINFNITQ